MKKIFLITFLLLNLSLLHGQKVALHKTTGVQFFNGPTGLAGAYTAATTGDTIFLPGGSFTSPGNIDKGLVVFGTGHYVDSTLATGKTFISGHVTLKENADNFHIEGLEILGNLNMAAFESVNNVSVVRCKMLNFDSQGDWANPTSENTALIGNVINMLNLANSRNALVANNIIKYGIDNTNGNLIKNNIILERLGNGYYENFRGANNTISNNVFLLQGSYGICYTSPGNSFFNNILAFSSPDYGPGATYLNNYSDIAPADVFISQSGNTFNYAHDYHLKNTALTGNDGTQSGIYGGAFPYKAGAVPVIPHFILKSIAAETNSNGELSIQIKVSAQEN